MAISYKSIQEQFNKVIEYSQGISNPNTDTLFKNWAFGKRDIIECFNGQLIYEYPQKVDFSPSSELKLEHFSSFFDTINGCYFENYTLLRTFLRDQGVDAFYMNKVLHDYTISNIDDTMPSDSLNVKIPKGMKLIKAFKYFVADKQVLESMQNEASRIVQSGHLTGTLCLSVHPLDFLSLSENTHNWRSCHALDGEFRAGNLSYMQDSSTIICYIKSDEDDILPNFPFKWNNKKWRTLIFLSSNWDMMFAGRPYPFSCSAAMDTVKDTIIPSLFMKTYSTWHKDLIKHWEMDNDVFTFRSPYLPVGHRLRPLDTLIKESDHPLHYNDLLHSSCYSPRWAYEMQKSLFGGTYCATSSKTIFYIGHDVHCLCCQDKIIVDSNQFYCESCGYQYGYIVLDEDYYECDICGEVFYVDDGTYLEYNSMNVCGNCYETMCACCDDCGESYLVNDIVKQELGSDFEYLCVYCNAEHKENKKHEEE